MEAAVDQPSCSVSPVVLNHDSGQMKGSLLFNVKVYLSPDYNVVSTSVQSMCVFNLSLWRKWKSLIPCAAVEYCNRTPPLSLQSCPPSIELQWSRVTVESSSCAVGTDFT